ncbi:YqcC family protein [Vibrio sp. SCSIO 43136]|uniref:YqcC family protein n=1 Tax=Vibrio sp. SCSIO 43136 TaxID=2819101 RepID=UPI002074FC8E|nr:YqcC family protein [Vibrio sp. SCSIO 43136]USD65893.1 YqcC family protein [Vibrio sp. SCSIO 43136]
MNQSTQINALLDQLCEQMQACHLWQSTPPSPEQLASTQPFGLDTLEPAQWLQWVFVARFRALIEAGQPLPTGFEIAPYFEEVWKEQPEYRKVLDVIVNIDRQAKSSC